MPISILTVDLFDKILLTPSLYFGICNLFKFQDSPSSSCSSAFSAWHSPRIPLNQRKRPRPRQPNHPAKKNHPRRLPRNRRKRQLHPNWMVVWASVQKRTHTTVLISPIRSAASSASVATANFSCSTVRPTCSSTPCSRSVTGPSRPTAPG